MECTVKPLNGYEAGASPDNLFDANKAVEMAPVQVKTTQQVVKLACGPLHDKCHRCLLKWHMLRLKLCLSFSSSNRPHVVRLDRLAGQIAL